MHASGDRAVDTYAPYGKVMDASRRVRWDIDADVIRGRRFEFERTFLPDGLTLSAELSFLSPSDRRLLSQVQGRTYAYLFKLVERFICANVLELSRDESVSDQRVAQALAGMANEELKHQELFRRLEALMCEQMPQGYVQTAEPNSVARVVLGKSPWAVLALTLHIELFTLEHYRASIHPEANLCPLWSDVFLYHWREESQHAILDELEFRRHDALVSDEEREHGVLDLIGLVDAFDRILQSQAFTDAAYFASIAGQRFTSLQREKIGSLILKAYRWQYIVSGFEEPRFQRVIAEVLSDAQLERLSAALIPLSYAMPNARQSVYDRN